MEEAEWGEFKLNDLFEISGTKSLDSNAIEFTGTGINFVGRTFENNGIQGKIQKRDFEPNKADTITATVIGNYKYVKLQKEPYYCSQNINKLEPKPILEKWNDYLAYFFIANIQRFVSRYDGQQGGYKLTDIKDHKIHVPIKNGSIDLEFMEEFIADIEIERLKTLEFFLSAAELRDYQLTLEEQEALDSYQSIEFKDFKVIDLFSVKNSGNILSRDIVENSGDTPYLCASRENNSVSSYISYDANYLDKGNCVFIGGKTFVVTYQENDFFSNDSHNLILYLKDEEKRTRLNQLYLATCVDKSLKHKYSWGDSISNKKIQEDMISLPVKNNKPDLSSLELLMSAVQKVVIKDVVDYLNSKGAIS